MSAIRPPALSPLFPAQSPPPPPVRPSRSDFFRAALDGVGALPGTALTAAPATASAPAARAPDDRPQRPGALLDIRV